MAKRIVTIYLNGAAIEAFAGETVAGTLLRHGIQPFSRHPVEDRQSSPFCMMGICHECSMEIDGQQDRQTCLVPVRDGLRIVRCGPVVSEVVGEGSEGGV